MQLRARNMMSQDVVRSGVNIFNQLRRPSGRGFFHALRRILGDKSVGDVSLGRTCYFRFRLAVICSFVSAPSKSIFFLEFKRDSVDVLLGTENRKRALA